MRTAAVGLVLLAVAACGTSPAQPASRKASPAPSPARQQAERDARELLTHVRVPPYATATSRPPTKRLDQPYTRPSETSLVDRSLTWEVGMSVGAAADWLRAHPPSGFTLAATGDGGGPAFRVVAYTYEPARIRPDHALRELQLEVTNLTDSTSGIRADGLAEWLDDTPFRDGGAGRRVHVRVAAGCPKSDARLVGVTNNGADLARRLLPAGSPRDGLVCGYAGLNGKLPMALVDQHHLDAPAAQRLATAVNALTLSHADGAVGSCPMDDGTAAILVLSYDHRDDVDLWYAETGCATIANGRIFTRAGDLRPVVGQTP